MDENNQVQTTGIRSALRKIEEKEGPEAALTTARKWASALDEIYEVACPVVIGQRPGGPQRFCAAVLLRAVNDYIAVNPITVAQS